MGFDNHAHTVDSGAVVDAGNRVDGVVVGSVVQADSVHVHLPGGWARPRQLPLPPNPFHGRENELAALDQALAETAGAMPIAVVSGAGGIGKSWLAARWAHRNVDRFPDGQLHVDLLGFDARGKPMDVAVALRGFLTALGVSPAFLPGEDHAQAPLYRSLLADRRVLVVLDNAASVDQVLPLLPGSDSCAVLITSRLALGELVSTCGARPVLLDVLSDDESDALLNMRVGSRRVTAEPDAARRLAETCGGFPLALSVVAGRAVSEPQLRLAELADELRDTGMNAVLDLSYRALAPDQARLFGLLGLLSSSEVSLSAVAALLGASDHDARVALGGLVRSSLLTRTRGDRYRMHDLVFDFARERGTAEITMPEWQPAMRRVLDFYVHTALAGYRLLEPFGVAVDPGRLVAGVRPGRFESHTVVLAWFADEQRCLWTVEMYAAPCVRLDALWQVAVALNAFHNRSGMVVENLLQWTVTLAGVGDTAAPAARALIHRYLGDAHLRVGDMDEAGEHLELALDLAAKIGDEVAQGHTHRMISVFHELRDDVDSALKHAVDALAHFEAVDDPVWKADTYSAIGWCLARRGDFALADVHCRLALKVNGNRYPPCAADALDTLGYIAHHRARWDEALTRYRDALAQYRDLDDLLHVPDTADRLGNTLCELGRTAEAIAAWRESLEIYRAQQRVKDVARLERKLGDASSDSWPYRRR
ncbi:tetratricopeptide repeat protein [Actinokineospora enzanensis]|uniref:tetratricopeptide repeat protein n=1 Tax=Actinokineospora enzanensis TaxID=155975 RepID=UPI000368B165|nr:tetratricopeptide repeat protein [Actinokineospora enzanensis]